MKHSKTNLTVSKLFKKYSINSSHADWNAVIDNWNSVEIYRLMNDGDLPAPDDTSILYICEFLDKTQDADFMKKLINRSDWGSLYLTAKRMIYLYSDEIIKINKP